MAVWEERAVKAFVNRDWMRVEECASNALQLRDGGVETYNWRERDARMLVMRAVARISLERRPEALLDCEEALRWDPKHSGARHLHPICFSERVPSRPRAGASRVDQAGAERFAAP
jgi:hypothetical protein